MINEKLCCTKGHLNAEDLTPQEKEVLYIVMTSHGASRGFAYDRFFKEGFSSWEMVGIDNIKHDFLRNHKDEIFPQGVNVSTADIINVPGAFYRTLGMHFGMKKQFAEYMASLGMGANSVLNKFSADDWKDYERRGIRSIVDEYEQHLLQHRIAQEAVHATA